MFKSEEQVKTFVDLLEKFTKAAIVNHNSPHMEDTIILNKNRDAFEAFIQAVCGITAASNTTDTLTCPECGSDMALRTNRQNGNKFWGCKKYPDCKGTRDENGLSREEREAAKYRKEEYPQEDGYSFNKKRNAVTETGPEPHS